MPIMEISIVPLGTKSPSVGKYVASCVNILKKQRSVKYELTAMGTIIQSASLKSLLRIAEKMHRHVLSKGPKRIVTTIKIDERTDKPLTIQGKIKSVQNMLAADLQVSRKRGKNA
jgi:uncharacterized protein (TIGR00106 family)